MFGSIGVIGITSDGKREKIYFDVDDCGGFLSIKECESNLKKEVNHHNRFQEYFIFEIYDLVQSVKPLKIIFTYKTKYKDWPERTRIEE